VRSPKNCVQQAIPIPEEGNSGEISNNKIVIVRGALEYICRSDLRRPTLLRLVRRLIIERRLQCLQSLQVELLIPTLGLSGQFPQFICLSNNLYFAWSSHANRIGNGS
jgi:hypothetical protein